MGPAAPAWASSRLPPRCPRGTRHPLTQRRAVMPGCPRHLTGRMAPSPAAAAQAMMRSPLDSYGGPCLQPPSQAWGRPTRHLPPNLRAFGFSLSLALVWPGTRHSTCQLPIVTIRAGVNGTTPAAAVVQVWGMPRVRQARAATPQGWARGLRPATRGLQRGTRQEADRVAGSSWLPSPAEPGSRSQGHY